MNQDQHIIPKIYLKQFGYQDRDGRWKVPTLNLHEIELMNRIDKTLIRQSNIKSLLTEVNIYDIPISNDEKKLLEDFLQLTEDNFPKVIEELKNNEELTPNKKDMLVGFVSLLFVRTFDYRMILHQVIDQKDYAYLKAIFKGNTKRIENVLNMPKESAINFLIAFSGGYIYDCLQNFKVSIIKAIPDEKWATTDNPVLIKCKSNEKMQLDFMGIDTKVVCPLTPEYLAYIDHEDSKISIYENMDKLDKNKVNEVSKNTFEKIWHDVTDRSRITKYLIIPSGNKK
jgi:uncharacterized protein DUF4238